MEQSTTQARYVPPETGGDLARQRTLGVLVAVILALIVRGLALGAGVDLGPTGATSPFALTPLVMTTVVAGAGAWWLLAVVLLVLFGWSMAPTLIDKPSTR